jgi:hypothetical protein
MEIQCGAKVLTSYIQAKRLCNVNFLADAAHTKDAEGLRKGHDDAGVKGQDLGHGPEL